MRKPAERGKDLIEYYCAEETDADMAPEDFRANAVDAITDLLHALALNGHDPREASRMALHHYLAEETLPERDGRPV